MSGSVNTIAATRSYFRVSVLKWLRRLHAWVGLWAVTLALLFSVSGFLLNHRAVLKIPWAQTDKSEVEMALPSTPADARELAAWLRRELRLRHEASRIAVEKEKPVVWAGQSLNQPSQWRIEFQDPRSSYSAEYWVGNAFVTVRSQNANPAAVLTRLHKGVGLGAAWVLLTDSLAFAMLFLALSGLWLWTKLHGARMVMAGLGLSSLIITAAIVAAAW